MGIVNVSTIVNQLKINERKDGRYEARLTINGKRKSFYGKSKAEVKRNAKDFLNKIENGYRDPEKITLNEYFEYWMKTYKKNDIEDSSYGQIYQVYTNQIKKILGKKLIGKITTKDIQDIIDMRANPKDKNIRPLAPSGLKRIKIVLNPCFRKAVEEKIIPSNPCEEVKIPKPQKVKKQSRTQTSLSDDEIAQFKTAALKRKKTADEYASRTALVMLIILNLGLRGGEMLALEWDNINFDKKFAVIRKTLQTNVIDFDDDISFDELENNLEFYDKIKDSTKTPNGERILPLNAITIFYLTELQNYDKRNNIKSKYVACNKKGGMLTIRALEKAMYRLVKISGIQTNASPHTLRHTFGSVLIRRGVSIEIVSKLMGHANVSITYNHYIHVLQEEAARKMDLIQVA